MQWNRLDGVRIKQRILKGPFMQRLFGYEQEQRQLKQKSGCKSLWREMHSLSRNITSKNSAIDGFVPAYKRLHYGHFLFGSKSRLGTCAKIAMLLNQCSMHQVAPCASRKHKALTRSVKLIVLTAWHLVTPSQCLTINYCKSWFISIKSVNVISFRHIL